MSPGASTDGASDVSTRVKDLPLTAEERRELVERPFPIVRRYGTNAGCTYGGTAVFDDEDLNKLARRGGRKPSMGDYEN
jgi:hypothetical protein